MNSLEEKKRQIKKIEIRLKKKFPKILKEIEHYEQVLQESKLNTNPKPSPQFTLE
jgi:hypothetical protein